MNIGKTMKELREERGLSRKEVAAELGITVTALWKIENGRVRPKQETLFAYCRAMGFPLAYFYNKSFTISDFIAPPA